MSAGIETRALLSLWDRGATLHPIDRALLLLAASEPGADHSRLALGERDARLLRLRAAMLGARLVAHEACPACGDSLEVELDCERLAEAAVPAPSSWTLTAGGRTLKLRPLDSRDAAAAAAAPDPAAALVVLLERAVEGAGDLPAEVASEVSASLAEHDPGAELSLDLACPACGHEWTTLLDVAGFVWAELSRRAEALLHDVHRLARAYGWSEGEILALDASRRAAYVAMVAA